ncbi:hypothetical protein [Shewanella algae]|uniref:hypothetical protein n=1 Tax=Shewanella algae TaxID=38313 RepID=UPI000D14DC95|nr:hypothetical protein [Shewanella algae]PST65064.1 hypothetical protein AYI77_21075 [Shewanella algae]PST65153.1 hypothetical protein AYI77_20660 [Shewanella algae]TVO87629.1 hypothetical protein AYI80_14185 [Shewanella algae]TXS84958.1 hypothetical protein AYI81_16755 [Shewanella algae]
MDSEPLNFDSALEFLNLCTYDTTGEYEKVRSSNENPNLYYVAFFVSSVFNYDWLQNLTSKLLGDEIEVTTENLDLIVTKLASIENINARAEVLNAEIADMYFELSTFWPLARPETNANKLKRFSSAKSLELAFKKHKYFNELGKILTLLDKQSADMLHAALSCEMAGLDRASKIAKKEFSRMVFLSGNELYQLLNTSMLAEKHTKRISVTASKAGNDAKHEVNRKVRSKAIELYKHGSFHNPRHAARQLLPQVAAISEKLGSQLEWHNNGFDRLYKWLLAAEKTE